MFHRIRQYDLIEMAGQWYRPRAYAAPDPNGMWDGWLVFFGLTDGTAIAPGRETTHSTYAALVAWAAGLTPVYLEGALARALALAEQPPVLAQLASAEYEALADAERLETAAEVERRAAEIDKAAATAAREDAERLHRQRLATEGVLAATEEAEANLEAHMHEDAADAARVMAADASRRRRKAEVRATGHSRSRKTKEKKAGPAGGESSSKAT